MRLRRAPIAVTMMQLVVEATKRQPTLEQCVALMSQAAYLESLQDLLGTPLSDNQSLEDLDDV